jgi:hypothetical protein
LIEISSCLRNRKRGSMARSCVWTHWVCIVMRCIFRIRSSFCFVVDRLPFLSWLMIGFFAVSDFRRYRSFIRDRHFVTNYKSAIAKDGHTWSW